MISNQPRCLPFNALRYVRYKSLLTCGGKRAPRAIPLNWHWLERCSVEPKGPLLLGAQVLFETLIEMAK